MTNLFDVQFSTKHLHQTEEARHQKTSYSQKRLPPRSFGIVPNPGLPVSALLQALRGQILIIPSSTDTRQYKVFFGLKGQLYISIYNPAVKLYVF